MCKQLMGFRVRTPCGEPGGSINSGLAISTPLEIEFEYTHACVMRGGCTMRSTGMVQCLPCHRRLIRSARDAATPSPKARSSSCAIKPSAVTVDVFCA